LTDEFRVWPFPESLLRNFSVDVRGSPSGDGMLRGRPSDDGRDRADGVIEDNSAWGEDVRDE